MQIASQNMAIQCKHKIVINCRNGIKTVCQSFVTAFHQGFLSVIYWRVKDKFSELRWNDNRTEKLWDLSVGTNLIIYN